MTSLFHDLPKGAHIASIEVEGAEDIILTMKCPTQEEYLFGYYISSEGVSIHDSKWDITMWLRGRVDLHLRNLKREPLDCYALLASIIDTIKPEDYTSENTNALTGLKNWAQVFKNKNK